MKKWKTVLVFLLFLGAGLRSESMPKTFGIPWDKALHFGAGYIVADMSLFLEKKTGIKDRYALGPFFAVATIAAVKESMDPVFDWNDFAATLFGGGVKVVIRW